MGVEIRQLSKMNPETQRREDLAKLKSCIEVEGKRELERKERDKGSRGRRTVSQVMYNLT